MRLAHKCRCGTKEIRIYVLGSAAAESKNSEVFVCRNRWRAGTMSKIKGLINVLSNGVLLGHPETMVNWRRGPFYKEHLTKAVGRKGIGKTVGSQNIYSFFPIS